jgi:hypothetical protein
MLLKIDITASGEIEKRQVMYFLTGVSVNAWLIM